MCKILLVEDHPIVRRSLEHAFQFCGADVLLAKNLGEAMRLYSIHGPDLDAVVTDLHLDSDLPFSEDSIPLLNRIAEERPGLHVVGMTVDDDKTPFNNHPAVKYVAPEKKHVFGHLYESGILPQNFAALAA